MRDEEWVEKMNRHVKGENWLERQSAFLRRSTRTVQRSEERLSSHITHYHLLHGGWRGVIHTSYTTTLVPAVTTAFGSECSFEWANGANIWFQTDQESGTYGVEYISIKWVKWTVNICNENTKSKEECICYYYTVIPGAPCCPKSFYEHITASLLQRTVSCTLFWPTYKVLLL